MNGLRMSDLVKLAVDTLLDIVSWFFVDFDILDGG